MGVFQEFASTLDWISGFVMFISHCLFETEFVS